MNRKWKNQKKKNLEKRNESAEEFEIERETDSSTARCSRCGCCWIDGIDQAIHSSSSSSMSAGNGRRVFFVASYHGAVKTCVTRWWSADIIPDSMLFRNVTLFTTKYDE